MSCLRHPMQVFTAVRDSYDSLGQTIPTFSSLPMQSDCSNLSRLEFKNMPKVHNETLFELIALVARFLISIPECISSEILGSILC